MAMRRGLSCVQACGLLGGCVSLGGPSAGASRADLAVVGFSAPRAHGVWIRSPDPRGRVAVEDEDESKHHGAWHTALLYIPNRIFDVLDIVRARVRVGPGIAVGARATEYADVFAGTYASIFVGIPGPRGEPEINWPFGLESNTGVEVSVADATTGAGASPNYGDFEFGVGLQDRKSTRLNSSH